MLCRAVFRRRVLPTASQKWDVTCFCLAVGTTQHDWMICSCWTCRTSSGRSEFGIIFGIDRRTYLIVCFDFREVKTVRWYLFENMAGYFSVKYFIFLFIKWFIKCHNVVAWEAPFLSQRWPKLSPVLIAPTHGGMARLSGPERPW